MQFTATLSKFDSPLWGHHVMVPGDISQNFLKDGHKRVVCILNGTETFQCALMPHGEGLYFININKELRDKLKLKVGSVIHAEIKKDESKYGLPMPEELEELLAQDAEGNQLFHALTPGKQRTLIFIIGKPKQPATRLIKAITVIEHLKANLGKIDFKRLDQDLKTANKL